MPTAKLTFAVYLLALVTTLDSNQLESEGVLSDYVRACNSEDIGRANALMRVGIYFGCFLVCSLCG